MWSDSSAHCDNSKGPLFLGAIRPLLVSGKLEGWSLWNRNVLFKLVSRGIWTQDRLSRLRGWEDDRCQLCHDGPGTMFHRCYECPALQTERDMHVSQEVRQAAVQRTVCTRHFPWSCHHTANRFAPAVMPSFVAQSGPRWPRRGTFSRTGNLKSAAFGAVPCDVLLGQSSRDGEDYAAAMAGIIAVDPLTLHTDCEGTIATISGPKGKALRAGGPRPHVWSRLLVSHDEVRAIKVKGHATQRDVEAGRTSHLFKRGIDYADIFAKKGADKHKPAFRRSQDSCCLCLPGQASGAVGGRGPRLAQVQRLGRHQGCRAEITGTASESETQAKAARGECCARFWSGVRLAFLHRSLTLLARQSRPMHALRAQLTVGTRFRFWGSSVGPSHHLLRQVWAAYWERADALCCSCCGIPSGRSSQLRKLRPGLFPKKRYPGWTVEHDRRPSLDEASWTRARPTTPKKQRAVPQAAALEHWESISGVAKSGDLALQRWDKGRRSLVAAYGLNDQLVAKIAFKAEGSPVRKTD